MTLLFFLVYCCCLLSYFSFKPHPLSYPEPAQGVPLKITSIQESKSQTRFSLQSDQVKLLAIYYKPKKNTKPLAPNYIIGKILSIKETKKQLQLISTAKHIKFLSIIRKKDLSVPLAHLKIGTTVKIQTAEKKFFRKLNASKKRDLKKIQNGIAYVGYVKFLSVIPAQMDIIEIRQDPVINLQDFKVGDFVQVVTKNGWKKVYPLKNPKYLFAQGFQFTGNIKTLNKDPKTSYLNIVETTSEKLISLYKTSEYPSFYWSVLLGKKPLDKKIYRLFQKNELVHLLVISGSHIDIIISFFMFLLTSLFCFFYFFKDPKNGLVYLRETRFFSVRARSFPLFIVLSAILIFYLLLTGSQQAGTRAILSFIIAGILYQLGLKISVFALLGLSIIVSFLFYSEWIVYPVGLLYSSTAVLSLYLCLPIIFRVTSFLSSKILKVICSSLLTSALVSLFIAPLSFYFFHYYNFISIFTNIPMAVLFFVFIYAASLASLLGLIFIPLGVPVLYFSDYCITAMLKFLSFTEHFSLLKFYVHSTIHPVALIMFYIAIIIGIQAIKSHFKISEMKT